MRIRSTLFRCSAILLLAMPVWGQENFEGREAAAHQVIVKFKAGVEARVGFAIQPHDIDDAHPLGRGSTYLLHSRSKGVAALVSDLSANPDVEYAEPDYIVRAYATPNDPYLGNLWAIQNTGQSILGTPGSPGADIEALSAWGLSTGSSSVVVGVVDTGIDYNHPDLAANVWTAPAAFTVTIGGRAITCAAGTHGFNAVSNTCDPLDDNNHGSHVSGTIGAAGNNTQGVVGVNWTTRIMALKFLNSRGSGTTSGAINAIEFAIQVKQLFPSQAGVQVLSNSWGGGGFSQALLDEINAANAAGMLFVAAAGNSGLNNDQTANYPSNYDAPNVVAVAATDNQDRRASFSSYGATTVDLGAPGVAILSTIRNAGYAYYDGTSMATPHVSGAAALVLSRCALDPAALKADLLGSVDPIPALAGVTVTGGRLNVYQALTACQPATPDFSLAASPPSATVAPGQAAGYSVNVSPSGGFNGTVNLAISGLPREAGATATFSPASLQQQGSSTLAVTTSTDTPIGTYPLTITGTSGALSHTATVTLVVAAPVAKTFTLAVSPSSVSVSLGSKAGYILTLTPSGGFNSTVGFTVSGLPSGASASFSPKTLPGSGSSTMTIRTSPRGTVGSNTLNITASGGGVTLTVPVTLTVN